jgi:hypothetical protein
MAVISSPFSTRGGCAAFLATKNQANKKADAEGGEHGLHWLFANELFAFGAQIGVAIPCIVESLAGILFEIIRTLGRRALELLCALLGGGTKLLGLLAGGCAQFFSSFHGAGFRGLERVLAGSSAKLGVRWNGIAHIRMDGLFENDCSDLTETRLVRERKSIAFV